MTITLEGHPDGSCWISDDRINACLSADACGIAEIGFHGLQPVSRNSRLLVDPRGALSVSIRTDAEHRFSFATVEWEPSSATTGMRIDGREYTLHVRAEGRSLALMVSGPDLPEASLVVRFSLSALFTGVHGERTWDEPLVSGDELRLGCRDRILLREWIRRRGPYAGDFLIPEPLRRKIFKRRCRSGLATEEDLKPEYRDSDLALYDARTLARLRGQGFSAKKEEGAVTFTARFRDGIGFRIDCAEDPSILDKPPQTIPLHTLPPPPSLELPGHPGVMRFFASLPGIVRSCTLRENGMTRATPGAYYWIWAWDNLVTALEMSRWGDTGGAERILRFINTHRDEGGAIPGRWTRTYEPLDTPPPGTLEFLLMMLASQCEREEGEGSSTVDVYPHALQHLRGSVQRADEDGLEPGTGFYPDLPVQFGRSEQSAVAMEAGAMYGFCRLLETAAGRRGDVETVCSADEHSRRILHAFARRFWDEEQGFPIDSVNLATGAPNAAYPLFSLIFLQTPLGIPLIRPRLGAMAKFARAHFQTPHGTRLLPAWDSRASAEDALSSWYPHWDIYLLKLFRRSGEKEGIITWLRSTAQVLDRLGYAPEFLRLDGFQPDDPNAWRRHGAVSNLNCATGWYRAIVEGLFGIEFDPGGMSLVPLNLEIPRMALRDLRHRGSAWEIVVEQKGGPDPVVRLDGEPHRGCMKVPARFHDGRQHRLEISYRNEAPAPVFLEILNAEVLESRGDSDVAEVTIRGLGTVDIVFPAVPAAEFRLDERTVPVSRDADTGIVSAQIPLTGEHTLNLRRTSRGQSVNIEGGP